MRASPPRPDSPPRRPRKLRFEAYAYAVSFSLQLDAASVIGPSWPGSDEGSVDDSFGTALGSGSDADEADVVIVAELQFVCAIIVGFTPAQHGRLAAVPAAAVRACVHACACVHGCMSVCVRV